MRGESPVLVSSAEVSTGIEQPDELLTGYLDEAAIDVRRDFYVATTQEVITICSDDRSLTETSADMLRREFPDALRPEQGLVRIWGSKRGLGAIAYAAGSGLHRGRFADFTEKHGGYEGLVTAFDEATDGRMVDHSDESKEQGEAFCPHGTTALGCLFCMAVGWAVSAIATDSAIQSRIATEQEHFGIGNDDNLERVIAGFEALQKHLAARTPTGEAADFTIPRQKLAQDGGLVAVLAGPHAKARETGVLMNFENTASNPLAANTAGLPFYGVDLAASADQIGRVNQEAQLFAWDDFMVAGLAMTIAVRKGLVGHDAEEALHQDPDPRHLRAGIIGNPQQAVYDLNKKYTPVA